MRAISAVLFLFIVAVASYSQITFLSEEDFAVMTADEEILIQLSNSIDDVEGYLGKPEKIVTKKQPSEPDYIRYYYKGLVVGFHSGYRTLTLLTITGPEFMTLRKVTVNDSLQKVRETYGHGYEWKKGIQYSIEDKSSSLGSQYLLTFWSEDGVIEEIDINKD